MPVSESKISKINSRSEYFQDILDKIPPYIIRWGNTGMLCIFILIGIGLTLIKYPDTIVADAIITTDNPPIEVHSKTSARIMKIFKKDQDSVKKNQWIMILENSSNYLDIIKIGEELKNVSKENFWESIQNINLKDSVNLGELQSTYQKLIKNIGELILFQTLKYGNKHLSINSNREKNLTKLKEQLDNQLPVLERELKVSQLDYDRYKKLDSLKVISRSELEQKELLLLNGKNKLEDFKNSIINTQLQAELLRKENVTLKNDESNSLFNIQRSILDNYNALLVELTDWQNKYVLYSPIDGEVNFFDLRTEDQYISNEQKVFTVSPKNKFKYFVLAKLPISNSGKVKKGQTCNIKVNNYPYTEFGMLKGKIESITSAAKEGFYNVHISLPNQLTTNLNKHLVSQSELTGQSEIITEDLTVFQRLFNSLISKTY